MKCCTPSRTVGCELTYKISCCSGGCHHSTPVLSRPDNTKDLSRPPRCKASDNNLSESSSRFRSFSALQKRSDEKTVVRPRGNRSVRSLTAFPR